MEGRATSFPGHPSAVHMNSAPMQAVPQWEACPSLTSSLGTMVYNLKGQRGRESSEQISWVEGGGQGKSAQPHGTEVLVLTLLLTVCLWEVPSTSLSLSFLS